MTALSGPIVFNNSGSGSDSAASGCGPATAISVMLQTSAGSTIANASWSGTINQGDLIYVPNISGRKFNVVAVVGSGTLTFDNNWDASSMGTAGYVGGKRAGSDLSTDAIFTEAPDGAVIEIEYTGTDYANTGTFSPNLGSTASPVTIKGTGSGQPRIVGPTLNANCVRLLAGSYLFENLQFIQNKQGGGGIDCFVVFSKPTYIKFTGCTFRSEQSQSGGSLFVDGQNTTHIGIFENCVFDGNNLSIYGFYRTNGTSAYAPQNLINCIFKGMTNTAIYFGDSRSCVVRGCIIQDCADGITFAIDSFNQNFIEDNIFYNLSGNGITFNNDDQLFASRYEHNIFSGITGHAFTANADYTGEQKLSLFDRNAFHNVTGSTHNNLTAGTNDITLTASPFVDPTASPPDFNISDSAGGGATLRSTNYTLGG